MLYNYIYLEYNTTNGANIDGTMGHKIKTIIQEMEHSVL